MVEQLKAVLLWWLKRQHFFCNIYVLIVFFVTENLHCINLTHKSALRSGDVGCALCMRSIHRDVLSASTRLTKSHWTIKQHLNGSLISYTQECHLSQQLLPHKFWLQVIPITLLQPSIHECHRGKWLVHIHGSTWYSQVSLRCLCRWSKRYCTVHCTYCVAHYTLLIMIDSKLRVADNSVQSRQQWGISGINTICLTVSVL